MRGGGSPHHCMRVAAAEKWRDELKEEINERNGEQSCPNVLHTSLKDLNSLATYMTVRSVLTGLPEALI